MGYTELTASAGLIRESDAAPSASSLSTDADLINDTLYEDATGDYWWDENSYGVDLGSAKTVHRIVCSGFVSAITPSGWYGASYDSFEVYYSDDNSTWYLEGTYDAPTISHAGSTEWGITINLGTPSSHRYWKVRHIDTVVAFNPGGGSGLIGEVEAFQSASSSSNNSPSSSSSCSSSESSSSSCSSSKSSESVSSSNSSSSSCSSSCSSSWSSESASSSSSSSSESSSHSVNSTSSSSNSSCSESSNADVVDLELASEADDGYWTDEGGFDAVSDTVVGKNPGGVRFHSFYRFENLPMKQKAQINSATIEFEFATNDFGGGKKARIRAWDRGDVPSPPTAYASIWEGPWTSQYVDWDMPDGNAGDKATTPDISAIVQEIVNRTGGQWLSGHDIMFVLLERDDTSTRFNTWKDFSQGSGNMPNLTIGYCDAPSESSSSSSCSSSSSSSCSSSQSSSSSCSSSFSSWSSSSGSESSWSSSSGSTSSSNSSSSSSSEYTFNWADLYIPPKNYEFSETEPAAWQFVMEASGNCFAPTFAPTLPTPVLVGHTGKTAALTLPDLEIDATATCHEVGSLDVTLPMISLAGLTGAVSANQLALFTLSAEATTSHMGDLDSRLPVLEFTATAVQDPVMNLDIQIPAIEISGQILQGVVGTLGVELDPLLVEATAKQGEVGDGDAELPAPTFTATGYENPSGSLDASLPVIEMPWSWAWSAYDWPVLRYTRPS